MTKHSHFRKCSTGNLIRTTHPKLNTNTLNNPEAKVWHTRLYM